RRHPRRTACPGGRRQDRAGRCGAAADSRVLRGPVFQPPARCGPAGRGEPGAGRTGRRTRRGGRLVNPVEPRPASPWRDAVPELTIAGITVAVVAIAAGAVAGWPAVAAVAIVVAALSMVVLRGLVPRSAAQTIRLTADKQTARAITGYAARRSIVASSLT